MSRRIAVVTAGLGQPSSTRLLADQLAAAAVRALEAVGTDADVDVIELREHAHALADNLLTGFATGALADSVDAVRAADAVVAVTPVFNGSYSGLFKSFVDVLDEDSLRGKPVLMGATAGTARHSLVLEFAMRPLFAHFGAEVLPTAVFAASEDFGSGGGPASLAARIERAGAELADAVLQRPPAAGRHGSPESAAVPVTPFEELLRAG